MARTPHRVVRIDDELWQATQECATAESITASEIIRNCLRRHVYKYIKSRSDTPIAPSAAREQDYEGRTDGPRRHGV